MAGRNGVVLTPEALAKLQAERYAKVDAYLEQLGNQVSIQNQCLDVVVGAAISHGGLPADLDERAALFDSCRAFAGALAADKLTRFNAGVRDLLAELKVTDVPEYVQWAARRVGVELVPRSDNH